MSKIFGISMLPVAKPFEGALEGIKYIPISRNITQLPKKNVPKDVYIPKNTSSKPKNTLLNSKKIIK